MILLVHAHPYPDRSRAGQRLLSRAVTVPGVQVRSLYEMYPDFDVDVAREQSALERASALVLQHPMYWYSVPGLLKHWMDKVLVRGFAYGGRQALAGKALLWVPTTGGDDEAYSPEGVHGHAFGAYTPAVQQLALFCGMRWQAPVVVHGAHRISEAELDAAAEDYAARLLALDDPAAPSEVQA